MVRRKDLQFINVRVVCNNAVKRLCGKSVVLEIPAYRYQIYKPQSKSVPINPGKYHTIHEIRMHLHVLILYLSTCTPHELLVAGYTVIQQKKEIWNLPDGTCALHLKPLFPSYTSHQMRKCSCS